MCKLQSLLTQLKLGTLMTAMVAVLCLTMGVPKLRYSEITHNSLGLFAEIKVIGPVKILAGQSTRTLIVRSLTKKKDEEVQLCLRGCPAGKFTYFREEDLVKGTRILVLGVKNSKKVWQARNIDNADQRSSFDCKLLRITEKRNSGKKQTQTIQVRESLYGGRTRNRTVKMCTGECASDTPASQILIPKLAVGDALTITGTLTGAGQVYAAIIEKKRDRSRPPTKTPTAGPDASPTLVVNPTPPAACSKNNSCSITLEWDPIEFYDDGSPLDSTPEYRIFWGTSSLSYPNSMDVGTNAQATISGLGNSTYYFIVRSYVMDQSTVLESTESEEFSHSWEP